MRAGRSIAAAAHCSTPLVVRASLPRTFLTLGVFVELGLVSGGIYLLIEVSLYPLEAGQAAVICAGVLLALATILLFYLVNPKRSKALAKDDEVRDEDRMLEITLTAYGEAVKARQRAELAMEEDALPGPM